MCVFACVCVCVCGGDVCVCVFVCGGFLNRFYMATTLALASAVVYT